MANICHLLTLIDFNYKCAKLQLATVLPKLLPALMYTDCIGLDLNCIENALTWAAKMNYNIKIMQILLEKKYWRKRNGMTVLDIVYEREYFPTQKEMIQLMQRFRCKSNSKNF
mgnify:CR=1 FL=1